MFGRMRQFWAGDARYRQILALSSLLAIQFASVDFGATPLGTAIALGASLATQALGSRLVGAPFDWRSPAITGLSLSLLLRAPSPGGLALAALIGVGSKFVLRIDGRHVFNPSGFAIAVLLVSGAGVWVSPGQWGAGLPFVAVTAMFALLILPLARRADVTLAFLASFGGLLLMRALWLGDPLAIPLHQLSTGSLLVFAFFMISDPPTTPNARTARILFAAAVALLAYRLAFYGQQRPALYFALIALSPLTPLFNRYFRAPSFSWRAPAPQGARA